MITLIVKGNPLWLPPVKGRKILLSPGTNKIDQSVWNDVIDHPAVVDYLASGLIAVRSDAEQKPVEPVDDLPPVRQMLPVIKRCDDAAELERWQDRDDRKTVLKAIQDRLNELRGDNGD